jgi:hypothetical protein
MRFRLIDQARKLQPSDNDGDEAFIERQPKIPTELTIPFAPLHRPKKGTARNPASQATLTAEQRDAILQSVARSWNWLDAILAGKVASVDDIAATENLAEGHVRFLVPLAFLSPSVIESIANGTAPADLTISNLARALPHKWSDQERALAIG